MANYSYQLSYSPTNEFDPTNQSVPFLIPLHVKKRLLPILALTGICAAMRKICLYISGEGFFLAFIETHLRLPSGKGTDG